MKLGKLNAAIDAVPTVYGNTRLGPVAFQKGSLKEALRRTYGGQRGAETGLRLDAGGVIRVDEEAAHG
jgi:hypothetical protein